MTDELIAKICEELAEGKSLRTICKASGMPSVGTVCRWLSESPAFAEQYARAREAQADAIFDEILDIADDSANDWIETEHGQKFDQEAAARARIRIDARKWMAGKLRPKVYGERIEIDASHRIANVSSEALTEDEWARQYAVDRLATAGRTAESTD